jgi:hypothetical protein
MIKAQRAHNQVYAAVHDAVGRATRPNQTDNQSLKTADQTEADLTRPTTSPKNGLTSPNQTDNQSLKTADQTAPVHATAATSPNQTYRPTTLSVDQTVRMISNRVNQQLDSGKLARELRHIRVACILAHDQISRTAALPSVDFDLLAADILATSTAGLPAPDQTARPALPDRPDQTGLVKSDWSETGLVKNQPDHEAIKKQAEIDELKQKLANQTAAIAAAKAEADRKAKEEADRQAAAAAAKAEADRKAKEGADRQAAAKAAKEEADRKAAEEAERGDLTVEQVELAVTVLADAIAAGTLGKSGKSIGSGKVSPILKAAGLPTSTDKLKRLLKLAGKRLVEQGIAANHRNPGNGNPDYIIA